MYKQKKDSVNQAAEKAMAMNSTDYGKFDLSKKVKTVKKKELLNGGAEDITSQEHDISGMNSFMQDNNQFMNR